MKKIYMLIIMAMIALPNLAQQEKLHLVREKSDNSTQSIALDALQRITFSGTTVNIEQTDGNTIKNEMSDIMRIAAYTGETSLTTLKANDKNPIQYISSDEISVNAPAGSIIEIYSVNGSHISTTRQYSDNGTLSIAALPKGIYLLRTNGRTYKFLKR